MSMDASCDSPAVARTTNLHPTLVNPRLRHGLRLQSARVAGVGAFLPEQVLTNAEVGRRLGDDGEWILPVTGIRERRIAAASQCTSDLAAKASLRALQGAGLRAEDVDLILVATNTPDMMFPATACLVQSKIGARKCPALDLKAGGAGFLYALEMGRQFIASHTFENVLVIGAEKLSSVVDGRDRATCALFGDGAGAVILQPATGRRGILGASLGTNGAAGNSLRLAAGGSRMPASQDTVKGGQHFLRMQGRRIFKEAVQAMSVAAEEALRQSDLALADIDCIIPHQSNQRIIDAFAERLGARPGQIFRNLDHCGNTSGASIPIALAEAVDSGRVEPGDLLLLAAFGSGLTWASTILEW